MKAMPFVNLKLGDYTTSNESIEKNIDKLTNFDAEIAIIGCLLWDNRSYEKIADFLNEEHFADEKNREIFKIKGDCVMDMGPYAASIIRLFTNNQIKKLKIFKEYFKTVNAVKSFFILAKFM